MTERIECSPEAEQLIAELEAIHGPLMFHQSGGCCDGSAPMCFNQGEFRTGANDVLIGRIAHCDFWMSADQFAYWEHTHLTLDVVMGRGSSFSLEIPTGKRFIIRSRLFSDAERIDLRPVTRGNAHD